MTLRRWWKLHRIKSELRRYSPQAREMLLAVVEKRTSGKDLPWELIEKAQAMVEGRKLK